MSNQVLFLYYFVDRLGDESSRMVKYILIAFVVVIIAVGVLKLGSQKKVKMEIKMPIGTVSSYSESSSGSSSGGHRSTDVKLSRNKQKGLVIYSKAHWHSDDDTVEEYYVSLAIFEEITKIIAEKKLYLAEKLPMSEEVILDAATRSVFVNYDSKERFRYSDNQQLTKEVRETEKMIDGVISKYVAIGERIPTIVPRRLVDEDDGIPIRKTTSLHVNSIRETGIHFEIANHSGKDLPIKGDITFYKQEGDEFVLYREFVDAIDEVYTNGYKCDEYYSVETEDFFEPGTYKAVVGELEDVFEVK